jgi:8-oxo-dGTP diphosphatase
LCVQRGENKYPYISRKYEFPGGKMEPGESRIETIRREILEELQMTIQVEKEFITVTHEYPDFMLIMHSYICTSVSDRVFLIEHIDFKWLEKNQLRGLDWAAADLPIVDKLIET